MGRGREEGRRRTTNLRALELEETLARPQHLDVSTVGLDEVDDDSWATSSGDGWGDSVRTKGASGEKVNFEF